MRQAIVLGLTAWLTFSCAATDREQVTRGHTTRAVHPSMRVETKPFRPISATELRRAANKFPLESVNRHLLSAVLEGREWPFRLVTAQGDHPAFKLLLHRAKTLPREGVGQARVALKAALAAKRKLDLLRSRFELHRKPLSNLSRALRQAAIRVELHGWRLAFWVYEVMDVPGQTRIPKSQFVSRLLRAPAQLLRKAAPSNPAYQPVARALVEYRELAARDSGGHNIGTSVGWRSFKLGARDPRIAAIRARLAAEGFAAPVIGDTARFDRGLEDALKRFQLRHSLIAQGELNRPTLEALQVPLKRRVQQLKKVLQHFREQTYYRIPTRVHVNIAGYNLRLYQAGRMVGRHRVIVGKIKRDDSGRIVRGGRIDQTPVLISQINALVLNPAWRVPQRIKEQELDVIAARRPSVYDDYRVYTDRNGIERVMQPPGPSSALGRVKFAFPYGNGVFLHDTPDKDLFGRRHRALSHGCVRVQDAWGLAQRILDADPSVLSSVRAQQILRTYYETPVRLGRPVPLFIDYVTAGVDADGAFRFFPDIYSLGDVVAARHPVGVKKP